MTIVNKALIQGWMERIDALELRERLLLLGTVVVVMFLLADTLVLQPVLKEQQLTEEKISTLETQLNGLHRNAQLLVHKSGEDPLQARRQTREQLRAELDVLNGKILNQLGALVEPAQAAEVLEQVLTGHPRLKLTTLSASSTGLDNPDLEQSSTPAGLARYQLDMVVSGNYLDLLVYLQSLEAMPWKFFWQQVDFQSSEYPHAETHIQLYTLGAEDA